MITGIALISAFVWCTSYADGYKTAVENRLPMVTVVGTKTCPACVRFDRELDQIDWGVRVAIKIDADKDPKNAEALGVTSYPTLILSDSKGKITHRLVGFRTAEELRKVLNGGS